MDHFIQRALLLKEMRIRIGPSVKRPKIMLENNPTYLGESYKCNNLSGQYHKCYDFIIIIYSIKWKMAYFRFDARIVIFYQRAYVKIVTFLRYKISFS